MAKIRALFTVFQMAITVTILIILIYIFKKQNKKIRSVWASIQMKLLGIKIELIGEIDNSADMIIMNHQSIMDITLFEHLVSRDIAWIAKKEIGDLPWFGRILKAPDMIMVERESKSSLLKLIKVCKDRLYKKRPLAIFPEGTRTNGKKLRKFKGGTKIIANKFKLKVQPFIILGSLEIFDSKNLTQTPGSVKIICLPSIQATKDSNWYEDTEELMKNTLEQELKSWKV